jgi:hypothetical protein
MTSEIMDQISKILEDAWLAKSRTKNHLSAKERKDILSKMEEALRPLLTESVPEQEAEEVMEWFGNDKQHDVQIEGTSRADVVKAWAEEYEIDLDSILHTQIGNVYFYTYPQLEGENYELWVSRLEEKETIS